MGSQQVKSFKVSLARADTESFLILPSVVLQTDTLNLLYSMPACVHESVYYTMPVLFYV